MAATYFLIRGIEPPDLRTYPDHVKIMYWEWVTEIGLKAKDAELAKGLDKDGKPLRAISIETRKHRKSAMTPTGRGDPSAPPLMPGRSLSRTRSLLAGRARKNYAEFYWRYDSHTGDQWGKVLAAQADRGRNVVGISKAAIGRVQAEALKRWNTWKRKTEDGQADQRTVAMPQGTVPFGPRRPAVELVGQTDTRFATFGIGASKREFETAVREGRTSGFMTIDQWDRHFRQSVARPRVWSSPNPAPAAVKGAERLPTSTGAKRGSTNRLLLSTWRGEIEPPPAPSQLAGNPQSPPPKPVKMREVVRQVEQEIGVRFKPAPVAQGNSEYTTIVVDVAKANASLAQDPQEFIGPQGVGRSAKPGAYAGFVDFLDQAKVSGQEIEQPRAYLDVQGNFALGDGRHRFAVLRDQGVKAVPVSVRKDVAKRLWKLFGWRG